MHASRLLLLAFVLGGCEEPAPVPTPDPGSAGTEPTAREVPPEEVSIPEAEPSLPTVPVEPEAAPLEAPPRALGLPEFTRGSLVRLPAVEITERTGADRPVPSVAVTDPQSRAALDELLERASHPPGRCRVLLATETLVSLNCIRSYQEMGMMERDYEITHFRVGIGGDVERIELFDLFLDGADEFDFRKRLLYRTAASQQRLVLTQRGLQMTEFDGIRDSAEEHVRIPYRAIAPYVRAGTVLGDLLEAEGLPLAAAGTPIPPMPGSAPALWGHEMGPLLAAWWRLTPRLRAQTRLITRGVDETFALVFVPGTDVSELSAVSRPLGNALFTEPYASIVLGRATDRLVVRARPGPRTDVVSTLPRGSIVAVIDGMIDTTNSRVDGGGWAQVATMRGEGGWTQGRNLAPLDAGECVPSLPGHSWSDVRAVVELWQDGTSVRAALFLGPGAATIRSLEGCSVGDPLLQIDVNNEPIRDLLFTRTSRDAGDSLVVVVSGAADAHTVRVYTMSGQEAVFRRTVGDSEVAVSVTRGRSGYVPLRIGQGARATSFSWDGTTLVEASAR